MKILFVVFLIVAAWALGELHGQVRERQAGNHTIERANAVLVAIGSDPAPLPKH